MLTQEWQRRIDGWRKTMKTLFYHPLGAVDFSGYFTFDHLMPEMAGKQQFQPMPEGTAWGRAWEYGWFRGRVTVPADAARQILVVNLALGDHRVVWVNGKHSCCNDYVPLTPSGKAGERFELFVEVYAGHGETPTGGGPVSDHVPPIAPISARQQQVGHSTFGYWNEEIYQLWLDTETLYQLYLALDKNSLRAAELADALLQMTLAVDLELPEPELASSVRAGRRILHKALACHNGSTAPVMACIGHSHLDLAWLWPLEETERKCARTFSSQLVLMERYPEFKFMNSQPFLYQTAKCYYPELYRQIKAAVKRGQWLPEGGMWVEADNNLPGGESLIRQFLHGKRFFREEFGVDSKIMWLPDVFGYSGALPQIMAGCGVDYFTTQKVCWSGLGGEPFPYNTFWWEGIDGTRVLAYIHAPNHLQTLHPGELLELWNCRAQKDASHKVRLLPFGHGDGGGGVVREQLEFLRRAVDLEGAPRCRMMSPLDFFAGIDTRNLPTWQGEIYFKMHRGTYTSQAKIKKGNRQAEFALRELEMWGTAAAAAGKYHYELPKWDRLWKTVLLNQFHDIIPGSAIRRVCERAEADYAEVLDATGKLVFDACQNLVKKAAGTLTVFNSLSWPRNELLELPSGWRGLAATDGQTVPVQTIGDKTWALVNGLPSCGWTSFRRTATPVSASNVKVDADGMENEFIRLRLNRRGELVSVIDKSTGMEFMSAPGNHLKMYRDVPAEYDAWEIENIYKQQPVPLDGKVKIEVIAAGPLVAILRVTRKIHQSELVQKIVLRSGTRRIDFRTKIDWQEKHKLLKVDFPTNLRAEDALHEIQFGYLCRRTHATRPDDAARFEVCNQKWTALAEENRGASVLNDCKYGINVEGGSINLTLLKAALSPDPQADLGIQNFIYSFYVWTGPLLHSGMIRAAYELNSPVTTIAGTAKTTSCAATDAENIVIETIKPAEDGSGDLVIRLYEAVRTATTCRLTVTLSFAEVWETDMLENRQRPLSHSGNEIELTFRPFEIKTLRLIKK